VEGNRAKRAGQPEEIVQCILKPGHAERLAALTLDSVLRRAAQQLGLRLVEFNE
jgi:hypothetical protein